MRESELNLIPSDVIEREVLKERVKFWIFVAIGCLLFLSSVNILIKIVNNSITGEITTLSSTSEELSKKMAGFKQLDMREKELLNMKDMIHHLSQKGPMIAIFTAIDKSINDNIILTHLEARYNNPNSTSVSEKAESSVSKGYFSSNAQGKSSEAQAIDTNSVILQGTASSNTDIASMLNQLSGQSLFKRVNLKYLRTGESEKGKTIMFEIECRLSWPDRLTESK